MSRPECPDDGHHLRLVQHDASSGEGDDRLLCRARSDVSPPPLLASEVAGDDGPSPVLFCLIAGGLAGAGSAVIAVALGLPVLVALAIWVGVGLVVGVLAVAVVLIAAPDPRIELHVHFPDGVVHRAGRDWLDGAVARPVAPQSAAREAADSGCDCIACGKPSGSARPTNRPAPPPVAAARAHKTREPH